MIAHTQVADGEKKMNEILEPVREEFLDVVEQMLYMKAANGIRPTLYMSSLTDFECSTLMLLEEVSEGRIAGSPRPVAEGVRFLVVNN